MSVFYGRRINQCLLYTGKTHVTTTLNLATAGLSTSSEGANSSSGVFPVDS